MGEEKTEVTEQPKRRRGNPNWTKKKSEALAEQSAVLITRDIQEIPISDDAVWLELYGSLLSTYSSMGPAVISAAATTADLALIEFKKRFPK
jgi:hypothetical protein